VFQAKVTPKVAA